MSIEIDRCGPFVPEISLEPSGVPVVTPAVKAAIIKAGLTGASFGRVDLRRVVKLDWHLWDREADLPRWPAGGEPENWILGRKHNPRVAEEIGPLWFLDSPEAEGMVPVEDTPEGKRWRHDKLDMSKHPGTDFARWQLSSCIVSSRALEILRPFAREWVEFRELITI